MSFKRILSAALAAAMLLPAAACSPAPSVPVDTTAAESTSAPETSAPETTAPAETEPAETEPAWDPAWPVKEYADPAAERKLALNMLSTAANGEEADKPIAIFDIADSKYQKLHDAEIHKTAPVSMRWIYDVQASWNITVPKDLSSYKAYSFWVYVPENAVGDTFYMYFGSENSATDGIDYFGKSFRMESAGWNFFSGRLAGMSINRTPLGWDQIDKLCLTSTGWSQTNHATTVLYLDTFYLHTNEDAMGASGLMLGDAFAFALDGSRGVYDNEIVEISYIDDTSTVFEENGTYWLPLSVFAAVLDKDSAYNASTRTLPATFGGKKYVFTGEKNTVSVDGKSEKLDFTVRVKGDSLFVPHAYAQSLTGYGEMYTDEMGVIVLSKDKRSYDLHKDLTALLNISYASLFTRPSGTEVLADMYDHLGGDVHPRIMLTETDFDRFREYYKSDKTFREWIAVLEKQYGTSSTAFMEDPVKWELTDGVRLLSISRKAKNKIIPYCFLYQVTGKTIYASRAWKEVNALVNFKDWHPEHFLDTAEICYPMAIAYDWLYEYLTPEQRSAMEQATLKFGLNPGLDRYEGRVGMWGNNNWTGVCNGGLVAAALAYSAALPDACTRVLTGAIKDVEKGMYSYAPDGGYLESPGYWSYGTDYLHVMMSSLDSACGTDYGLYKSPGFAASAYFTAYFETEDGSWGFHDSGSGVTDTNCLSWFAKKSGDPDINRLRRNSIDAGVKGVHVYDLMWYDPKNISESVQLNLDSYYSEVGSVSMRNTWDKDAIFVGLHGGDNAASHGDLDIGNFVLDAAGKHFLVELGSDYYNLPTYFGANRWTYYRKRAEGQNTLVIGDVSYKKPDQNAKAISSFVRVENNDTSSIAIVDMAPAYDAVTDGQRGVLFTNDRSTVILQDEIHMSSPNIVRWGVHTKGRITVNAGGRSAFIQSGEYFLYCEIVSADDSLQFSFADANSYDPAYKNQSGEYSRSGIRRLMIVTPDKVTDFEVAVVFKVMTLNDFAPAPGTTYSWTPMKSWTLD